MHEPEKSDPVVVAVKRKHPAKAAGKRRLIRRQP